MLFLLELGLVLGARAAPCADLWPRWQANDPASRATIDHSAFGTFLEHYLVIGRDGVNRVAYGEVAPVDRAALEAYIARLGALPISRYDRAEQEAFWINLYNALTVDVVLRHYPVDSIRDIDISPGWFSDGPWGKKLIEVEGAPLSIDDIEHRILRPIWRDPRIHYALNCAALGCPSLQPEPFRAADLDARLKRAAIAYVNDPRGVRIEHGKLVVSSIYDWYEDDFGGNDRGVIAHLERYARPALEERLQRFSSIDGHAYDWRLNDAGAG